MVEFRSGFNSNKSKVLNKIALRRMWWLFSILSCVFILLGVLGIVFREDTSDLIFGIVMIIVGVLFTPLVIGLSFFVQKKLDKTMPILSNDTIETFTFEEDHLTITLIKGNEYESCCKAKYSYLYKAVEYKDCYVLYISKMQSHVIEKASLTQGTLGEMNTYLINNLGTKFKASK